ncbi:MAG TPA: DUF4384 domain-containing protein [Syntrophales bacterium]|nr:DUF4384 domain-containing protein [Syntrophales bacterium]
MQRKQWVFLAVMTLVCAMVFTPMAADAQKSPKGAKAIFDSGDGAAVRMSSGGAAPSTAAPAPEKYVGISYKIALMKPNGDFSIVPRTRTFRSGERIKMLVRTNRPGYLTIMNIGPTGNTTVLFNEYVEAKQLYEIPKSTALKFAGAPGTEKVMIMLSNNQNPIVGGQSTTVATAPVAPPPAAPPVMPPPPAGDPAGSMPPSLPPPPPGPVADAGSSLPPPPPMAIASSMQGSKDIVVEDHNRTGYAVISPKAGWKPSAKGTKDIILESDARDGSNYGVVPASALDEGGILTLDLKLTHK